MPLISVIIPSYNRRNSISVAIESVLKQSFADWELIIVDDGSEDNTSEEVKSFLINQRVQYVFQKNQGVCSARNKGVSHASGEWIVFLDSDDVLFPDALENFKKAIESNQKAKIWKSGFQIRNGEKETIVLPEKNEFHSFIPGSFILKKELFDLVGGYDEKLKFSENTELFHRVGLAKEAMEIILKPTVVYFNHSNGASKNLRNMTESLLHILEKHQETLSKNERRLYNQIIGVNALRFKEFDLARKHILKAYLIFPWKIETLGRLIISYMPLVSKKIYRPL